MVSEHNIEHFSKSSIALRSSIPLVVASSNSLYSCKKSACHCKVEYSYPEISKRYFRSCDSALIQFQATSTTECARSLSKSVLI